MVKSLPCSASIKRALRGSPRCALHDVNGLRGMGLNFGHCALLAALRVLFISGCSQICFKVVQTAVALPVHCLERMCKGLFTAGWFQMMVVVGWDITGPIREPGATGVIYQSLGTLWLSSCFCRWDYSQRV